jgi:hypothetical protein
MNVKRIILSTAAIVCLFGVAANATNPFIAPQYAPTATYSVAQNQVNVSGATLFTNFFSGNAATNDWIDVDGDGLYGFDPYNLDLPDQLARTWNSTNIENRWLVTTRGMGSGTGLKDMLNWNYSAPVAGSLFAVPSDASYVNRTMYYQSSGALAAANPANPGSAPIALTSIDIAVMDVPTTWMVSSGSSTNAYWHKAPMAAGYGKSTLTNWAASESSVLGSLTNGRSPSRTYNCNTGSPDAYTIYDAEIAWVPVAIIANRGTGVQNISEEELRHLYVTGRMSSGENLWAVTREQSSGTKNSAMNSIGVDPSWGRGDNYSSKITVDTNVQNLGSLFQFNNLGATGIVEKAVQNSRLAIGYVGGDKANTATRAGKYEALNVKKIGGANYVRMSATTICDNDLDNGWRIGGNETFATVGSPLAGATYPMANQYAADYIKNILASIADFENPIGGDSNSTPGQYLASKFILASGVRYMPIVSDPATFVANAGHVQAVTDYIVANNTAYNLPAYGAYGYGLVPGRTQLSSGSYSDGRTYVGTDNYYTSSATTGNAVYGGASVTKRNAIAGDFLYDGKRNTLDINAMMQAYASPRTFEAGNNNGGDGYVIVELIGDYNGDGNFDDKDICYFADGLAIDPVTGKLNRAAGFEAVDKAWTVGTTGHPAGNFFNTTVATTGRSYLANSGWSKADIAGKLSDQTKIAAGAAPMGADGVINTKDVDYINYILRKGMMYKATGQTPPVNANVHSTRLVWSNLDDAAIMDLSCDLNGDLIVDQADLDVLIVDILGTNYGDFNLDGVVNATDRATIVANISTTYGKTYAQGDLDGDGYVTQNDLNLFDGIAGGCGADINCDHVVDFKDFAELADHWLQTM